MSYDPKAGSRHVARRMPPVVAGLTVGKVAAGFLLGSPAVVQALARAQVSHDYFADAVSVLVIGALFGIWNAVKVKTGWTFL